jgi:hypothetical protein
VELPEGERPCISDDYISDDYISDGPHSFQKQKASGPREASREDVFDQYLTSIKLLVVTI